MWLTTDRPIDEMDTAKLREIVALSDYYPPHVVKNARDELLKAHPQGPRPHLELTMSTTDGTSATPLPDNTPTGWRCPTCGRGNAPWSSVCPCQGPVYASPYQPWPTWPMWPIERRRRPWYEVTWDGETASLKEHEPG